MTVLVESFLLITYCGLWKPSTWSGWKSHIYTIYTIIAIFLNCAYVLSGGIDILFVSDSISDVMDNVYILLSVLIVCIKMVGVLGSCKDIDNIRRSFHTDPHKPNTSEEMMIQKQYDHTIRIYFLIVTTLYELTNSTIILARFFIERPADELPIRAVMPYSYSAPTIYWLTAVIQFFTIFLAGSINAGFDTLYHGMMLQICAKVSILKLRFQVAVTTLRKMGDDETYDLDEYKKMERRLLISWVNTHISILSLSGCIESVFSGVIFTQYFTSAFLIVATVYLMSEMHFFTVEFACTLVYLIAIICQIFMLCFTANMVTLEFADLSVAMYDTNWVFLSISAKRYIIIMMCRTLRPIVFTSGHMVTLSLESFKAIMKVAYSMNSVLSGS